VSDAGIAFKINLETTHHDSDRNVLFFVCRIHFSLAAFHIIELLATTLLLQTSLSFCNIHRLLVICYEALCEDFSWVEVFLG